MMKNNTESKEMLTLLANLIQLLERHRPAFKQSRPYWRMVGLVLAELFNFGRHTISQGILTLGETDADWSGWYRLFSRKRFEEVVLNRILFRETLVSVPESEPYVTGIDGTQVRRSSLKMPGTSWLKAGGTAAFRPGIARAQRFLTGAWLTPLENGYSRAIPLRFLPAFPPKAVAGAAAPRREWSAGLDFLRWVGQELDEVGRSQQPLLALADGSFDVLDLWRGLPQRVWLVVRTARNRALYWLPEASRGRGRPASYGQKAPSPAEWLHVKGYRWPSRMVLVRGKQIEMRYRLVGPFIRDGVAERPLFLLVVRGIHRQIGKKKRRYLHRDPAFYLISAVREDDTWRLPLPLAQLLPWLWQRWELEVCHREMKSGLGVGEKQCWNPRSAVVSVQWSVWVYAVLLLAGYQTWGLCGGPAPPARWWPGAKRWSFNTLWRSYRAALWGQAEFRPLWLGTGDNWPKKETWLIGLGNAIAGSMRS
jgi:hypothetical protein